jgi:hypothetical protein
LPATDWVDASERQKIRHPKIPRYVGLCRQSPIIPIAHNVGVAGGASWGDDNSIFFSTLDPTAGLLRVPPGGGEPAVVSRPDPGRNEIDHTTAMVLPGSRTVLTAIVLQGGKNLNVGAFDLKTSRLKSLLPGNTPTYVDVPTDRGVTGYIVFGQDGALPAVKFDPRRLELVGEPITLIENVQTTRTGRTQYALSRTGMLIYLPATPGSGSAPSRSLVWMDRRGHETPINAPPRAYGEPVISPDGRLVALAMRDQESDIWIWDFRLGTLRRLTFGPALSNSPKWTPDGRSIIFSSTRGGRIYNIYKQPADGSESAAPCSRIGSMRSHSRRPTISVAIRISSWNGRATPKRGAESGSRWGAGSRHMMEKWHCRKWSAISLSVDTGGRLRFQMNAASLPQLKRMRAIDTIAARVAPALHRHDADHSQHAQTVSS